MPYIKNREFLDRGLHTVFPENTGELNYCLTKMILDYLGETPNYQKYNDVIGVLQCIIQEIYRRRVAPYEDLKIKENGDIY
jgi:hypothetical protein